MSMYTVLGVQSLMSYMKWHGPERIKAAQGLPYIVQHRKGGCYFFLAGRLEPRPSVYRNQASSQINKRPAVFRNIRYRV